MNSNAVILQRPWMLSWQQKGRKMHTAHRCFNYDEFISIFFFVFFFSDIVEYLIRLEIKWKGGGGDKVETVISVSSNLLYFWHGS